ncbi:MAG: amino acid permease [Bdellovibrionota bacterium]
MDQNDLSTLQASKDANDLKHLGYAQELLRNMGGFSNFAISFSIISILTGAIQLYGYGLQHGGPFVLTVGWWIVSFFTLAVALSMAELASAYPTAGALYHWSAILGGRTLGWFTACFNTMGQFAILAGIDFGLALLLRGFLGLPENTAITTGLYAVLLFSHAVLNHLGIRIVARLNDFSAWYHVGVVFLLIGALVVKGFTQPVSFLVTQNNTDGFSYPYSFLLGLLLAQWTLTGYDASAHVSEETIDPRRRAPWGIFLAVAVSIVFGSAMLSAITLSIPDLAQATAFGEGAFTEVLRLALGPALGNTIVGLVLIAMWLCGLSALTSASRMVYAFARDGGLPYSKSLASVSQKHRTPAVAIWTLVAIALLLALSVKAYSAVVSIATIALYISYGLPIAAGLYAKLSKKNQVKGPWNLGRFSTPVSFVALVWICFITTVFVLPPNDQAGVVIGGLTLSLIAAWALRVRSRFQGPKIALAAHFEEAAQTTAPTRVDSPELEPSSP